MFSIDTETCGLDIRHGARPFFVTCCSEDGAQEFFEWDVSPLTRRPSIPKDDITYLRNKIDKAVADGEFIVGQNVKFDAHALRSIGVVDDWPWHITHDTLVAGHLLASNQPHNLTDMALQCLAVNIQPYEGALEEAAIKARREARKSYPAWRIAKAGLPEMPSVRGSGGGKGTDKDRTWKNDTWLPRAIAKKRKLPQDDPWWSVLRDYGNADSAITIVLWRWQEAELRRRGLWKIYGERMRIIPVAEAMEIRGVTLSKKRLEDKVKEFEEESAVQGQLCVDLVKSRGAELVLPKAGNNKSLLEAIFVHLGFDEVVCSRKTGKAAFNAEAMAKYKTMYPPEDDRYKFTEAFQRKRRFDTALSYLAGYSRFWRPMDGYEDFFRLHSNLNPTGTDTLRWSSSNPNEQNISAKEEANLREVFGPAPGREWWKMDAQNLELRIPVYESGEQAMIELFEKPTQPPYFGSNHLLVAHILHPRLFEDCRDENGQIDGRIFKKRYESTWYRRVKMGNFSVTCLPMSSEALTRDGWRKYDELRVGDEVLGYDTGSDKLRWTPVLRKLDFNEAPLVRVSNNHFEAVSTPDHRWAGVRRTGRGRTRRYVKEFFTTEEFVENSERLIRLSATLDDKPSLQISEAEAALIGLVYGDGCIEERPYVGNNGQRSDGSRTRFRVRIFQSKGKGIEYIESLLSKWGGRFTESARSNGLRVWSLKSDDARDLWRRAGLLGVKKKTDPDKWSQFVVGIGRSGRAGFLGGVFAAEGTIARPVVRGAPRERAVYSQNAGPFADAIKLAIFLGGGFPTSVIKKNYYGSSEIHTTISSCKPVVSSRKAAAENLGTAAVWCITTGLGTFVARQESGLMMITGNCGAVEGSGTADKAFGVEGAQTIVAKRMTKMAALSKRLLAFAEKHGYVETMPDQTVNPHRGYPIMSSRTEWGRVRPTTPFSHHVQGTAMWWMARAMARCHERLRRWRDKDGFDGFITLQVHDELVFDFPKGPDPVRRPWESNLRRALILKSLVERGGDDLIPAVPTPVSIEYHAETYADGAPIRGVPEGMSLKDYEDTVGVTEPEITLIRCKE